MKKRFVKSFNEAHKIIQDYSLDDAYKIWDLFNSNSEHNTKHHKFIAACILTTIEQMQIKDAYDDMIKSMEDIEK